ncbi:hypothetical protein [Aequorivita echinoideorum]|uniref:Uncharacterized protein n=1 Tax=Aequorivita echinoideorum TaxID=1549647 RepID=A0ABS5S921_9FLAO|nr:hypothetical protein [Aequorivita echinoideorum]MBT0608380.1 hypothetical protein [Aequorivita echinoideorum]
MIGFMATLMACGGTQSTPTEVQSKDRGRSNKQSNTSNQSRNNAAIESREAMLEKNNNDEAQAMREEMQAEMMHKMFTDIKMDEEQIANFQEQWNSEIDMRNSNPDVQPITTFERIEIQDRIMKEMLRDEQFEQYQLWVRENADYFND